MSSAASSSRTANIACLKARFSTPARKVESSLREASGILCSLRDMVSNAAAAAAALGLTAPHQAFILQSFSATWGEINSNGPREDQHADRRRNRGALPPGGGRRVRVRLSRRRGALHLRRAVQAGQGEARAGAPRAGSGARRRRLLARLEENRRGAGDVRPRRD